MEGIKMQINKTKPHKSIIGQLRKKYGLKDNTPIHKVEQVMIDYKTEFKKYDDAITDQMVEMEGYVQD